MSVCKVTHVVYRRRGGVVIRQFASEAAANAFAAKLRMRFKGNRYGVRPISE